MTGDDVALNGAGPVAGRRAWMITGAGSGFGRAIALELDVTDTARVAGVVEEAVGRLGRMDVLVKTPAAVTSARSRRPRTASRAS